MVGEFERSMLNGRVTLKKPALHGHFCVDEHAKMTIHDTKQAEYPTLNDF